MRINAYTQLYGIIGDPVLHSRSPILFNGLFREHGLNKVYLAFEGADTVGLLRSFSKLGGRGLSVTIPHKTAAFHLVDRLSPLARRLGAINTIIFRGGRSVGENYDGIGAIESLERYVPDWRERKTLLIGAGGAARGIGLTMRYHYGAKGRLDVLARARERAKFFLGELLEANREVGVEGAGTRLLTFEELGETALDYELIINTTPLGMAPNEDGSALGLGQFPVRGSDCVVYDIVYTPLETLFLRRAREKGLRVITGEKMFLAQAGLQFELWTGLRLTMEQLLVHF